MTLTADAEARERPRVTNLTVFITLAAASSALSLFFGCIAYSRLRGDFWLMQLVKRLHCDLEEELAPRRRLRIEARPQHSVRRRRIGPGRRPRAGASTHSFLVAADGV